MTVGWKDVGCASIPVRDVSVLADLRRGSEIRVSIGGDRAWIRWEPGSEVMQHVVVRRLLPLRGVELFTRRGGRWYRLGEHLPAFGVPVGDGLDGVPLGRILLPQPMTVRRPSGV